MTSRPPRSGPSTNRPGAATQQARLVVPSTALTYDERSPCTRRQASSLWTRRMPPPIAERIGGPRTVDQVTGGESTGVALRAIGVLVIDGVGDRRVQAPPIRGTPRVLAWSRVTGQPATSPLPVTHGGRRAGAWLTVLVAGLTMFGLVMVLSASSVASTAVRLTLRGSKNSSCGPGLAPWCSWSPGRSTTAGCSALRFRSPCWLACSWCSR
ncbi:MAG: hypothetical protein R2710_15560 [Acidimicrobiales bacterium]